MPSENFFRGQVVTAGTESMTLPDGTPARLDVVRHPGGAAVVAVDDDRRVCLVRHYRPVVDEWLWEVPAGKRDGNEVAVHTATRELAEEVGLVAARWVDLGAVITSPGVFTERVSLFLATALSPAQSSPASDELFQVHWLDLDEALERARDGDIRDAKTIIALWRGSARLQRERT